jgi:predicted DNA binding protein
MIRARFRVGLPDNIWPSEISTSFPDATLRLLTGVPKGDRALELGEARATNPSVVSGAIRRHPDIDDYDELYLDDTRVIGRYEATEKSLYEFLWDSSLPPEFPIIVEDGEMEFGVTATQPQFEAFGSALDEMETQYELLSLVHTDDRDQLLTDRQRECLTVAHNHGYFDVPRDATLAAVADTLGVDPSSASETIRRATRRVIADFVLTDNR